jgi:hypothetical protein
MVGHGWPSLSKCGTHPEPETDATGHDPEADADERERRRGACRIVDEEAEDRARDDRAGEKASEPREVSAPQRVVGALIGHSPGSLSLAGGNTSALRPLGEVNAAKADNGAKLPQRPGPPDAGISGLRDASGMGLRGAVVMAAAVLLWARAGCL